MAGGTEQAQRSATGVALLFAPGTRPSLEQLDQFLTQGPGKALGARITHREDAVGGWVEFLSSGLTFDLRGLAPAPPAPSPQIVQRIGIAPTVPVESFDAMELVPGPHLSGGQAMLPVVRMLVGFAFALSAQLGARAVCWLPAMSCMDSGYFGRVVTEWLDGGPFPALGLTAILPVEGGFTSKGLEFFLGQEVILDAAPGEEPNQTVKLLVRVIDSMVSGGKIEESEEMWGPAGEPLLATPSQDGRVVRVSRTLE